MNKKDSANHLSIRQAANYLKISPSLLRKYEEVGLIAPDRGAENNYRQFGSEEIDALLKIRQYRKLGISLNAIGDLLRSKDREKNAVLLKEYQDELQKRIRQETLFGYYLDHMIRMMDNEIGKIDYMELPDQIYEVYQDEKGLPLDPACQDRIQWLINENFSTYLAILLPEYHEDTELAAPFEVIVCSPSYDPPEKAFRTLPGGEYAYMTIEDDPDDRVRLSEHIRTAARAVKKDGKAIRGRIILEMNAMSERYTIYLPISK